MTMLMTTTMMTKQTGAKNQIENNYRLKSKQECPKKKAHELENTIIFFSPVIVNWTELK